MIPSKEAGGGPRGPSSAPARGPWTLVCCCLLGDSSVWTLASLQQHACPRHGQNKDPKRSSAQASSILMVKLSSRTRRPERSCHSRTQVLGRTRPSWGTAFSLGRCVGPSPKLIKCG